MVLARIKDHIVFTKGVYHADFKRPLFICTDGSKRGIGGYIFQKIDGEERVISYFSRATTKDERKWDTRESQIFPKTKSEIWFSSNASSPELALERNRTPRQCWCLKSLRASAPCATL